MRESAWRAKIGEVKGVRGNDVRAKVCTIYLESGDMTLFALLPATTVSFV